MTIVDYLWSFGRSDAAFGAPDRRKLAFDQTRQTTFVREQYIETIGGGKVKPMLHPRLPPELVIYIVLSAARDMVHDSAGLLQLASVSRACHTAILCQCLLPNLKLYGATQMRAFVRGLELNTVGLRDYARARVHSITFRHLDLNAQQHRAALFDASSAQLAFERDCMALVRRILSHLEAVHHLVLEGIPRRLLQNSKLDFDRLSANLTSFVCQIGHYADAIGPLFGRPSATRWSQLTHLQLHGPHFRFSVATATALSQLPALTHLALIVPTIVPIAEGSYLEDQLDVEGRANPLQALVSSSPKLHRLMLVAHEDSHFVGNVYRTRFWLRAVRQSTASETSKPPLQIQLVTVCQDDSSRIHPLGVSTWMMDRAEAGQEWTFESSDTSKDSRIRHFAEMWDAPRRTVTNDFSGAQSRVPTPLQNPTTQDALDRINIGTADDSE